jgi:hypothetical protein
MHSINHCWEQMITLFTLGSLVLPDDQTIGQSHHISEDCLWTATTIWDTFSGKTCRYSACIGE